jgi:hypothetical protein
LVREMAGEPPPKVVSAAEPAWERRKRKAEDEE